jgi:PAS domain S-box-containing protein
MFSFKKKSKLSQSDISARWILFPFTISFLSFFSIFAQPKDSGSYLFLYITVLVGVVSFFIGFFALRSFLFLYDSFSETLRTLREQNQRLSLVVEGVNDGVWDWDIVKNTVVLSPRWFKMFGYEENQTPTSLEKWFSFFHPEDVESVVQGFDLHFQKRSAVFHVEHRIKVASGDYRWVIDRGHAVWGEHGEAIRVAGTTTDISQTKEVEKVLQSKTEELEKINEVVKREKVKYETLLTSIGDGIIATDKNGVVVVMNPQAEIMLGYKISQVIGKLFTEIFSSEQNEKEELVLPEKRPVLQTLAKGSHITAVSYYFRADGSKFPASVTSSPVMFDHSVIGAVVVFRDITREKEIDKSKTEFVSLASHQLRTPLSAIRWYSEMLGSEKLGALNLKQKEYLDEIYRSNRRMIDLVNSLLNVSRIDMGTFAVEPTPTDIKEITQSVLKELFVKIEESKLKVTEFYQEKLPKINADPKLIRIIIQNLLSNAVKYTHEGDEVSVSLTVDDKNMLIKVSDTGIGIPKSVQDKMFTKLFRADNARVAESEGTGLGLYIIKSIVERSGGKTWFISEENKGSTFFVEIPLSGMTPVSGAKDLV